MMLLKLTSGSSYSSLINESLVGGPIYRKTMLYISRITYNHNE